MKQLADLYKRELLENVLPFWIANSRDEENGGFFTCLDRQGKVFDTDKFMWLQGREVWMFSMLYDKVMPNPQWKDMALLGARFMEKHGRDVEGNWYFSTTKEGKPLIQPYNIFSDCFAAMGFGALYKIEQNPEYYAIAKDTFDNILRRRNDPKGKYTKNVPGTRPLKNFALPMILCNLSLELEHILGSEKVNQFIPEVLSEVMDVFYHKETGLILENVLADGSFSDSFEGRLLNPGHAIEAMWFIMDLAVRLNDPALAQKACDIGLKMLEHGWDHEYGGIFYFMDIHNRPPQQLEWDQKLWWVHLETLVFLAKGWQLTGNEACQAWFEKVHTYTWEHFKDKEHPEWFGYLNRQGQPLLQLKGGKWKGCFHVPRGLYQVWQTLEKSPAFHSQPVIV
ncbi:AGE family epimerase/isomerase [Chitinophaga barathri]|uniref:AGE family epimerase/isomerase n=1 Tax=Chitinophaga barathri TaxID=1647451 RepID=A0A3N4MAT4_9BACT|nr:AGE family epimerase/isomerase [Chitinophaga barathri]RPD40892.1 AGE family epimerase/isomerase [Chitinophaga barathri]